MKKKYGRYPDELQFLMFRRQHEPVSLQFEEGALNEAVLWAKGTVSDIRNSFDYRPQCDEFYGNNLCNHRDYCKFKVKPSNNQYTNKKRYRH